MYSDEIRILQADTFMVSDRRGDVDPALNQPDGLFYHDMRHLSRWQLRLNGREETVHGKRVTRAIAILRTAADAS